MALELPPPQDARFIAEGSTAGGPWVLETWRSTATGWRIIGVRHPGRPRGGGGGRGYGTGYPLEGGPASFNAPASSTQRSLMVGAVSGRVASVRFEGASGLEVEATLFPINGDPEYRAFLVPLDDPPAGRLVARDADGHELSRLPISDVAETRAMLMAEIERRRAEIERRRSSGPPEPR